MGFENEEDAKRVLAVLYKRFERFKLKLHPAKTRLVDFRSPPRNLPKAKLQRYEKKTRKLESFNFLGFTHLWRRSRDSQYWVMAQVTAKDRFARALKSTKQWCYEHMHLPIEKQHEKLCLKIKGHFAYYSISGNFDRISRFAQGVNKLWFRSLNRRGAGKRLTWGQFNEMLFRLPLPKPYIVHRRDT